MFPYFQHRDTKEDNLDIKFEFSDENKKVIMFIYYFHSIYSILIFIFRVNLIYLFNVFHRELKPYWQYTQKVISEQP